MIKSKQLLLFALYLLIFTLLHADVVGTANIQFDIDNDGLHEMELTNIGLGIGVRPSSNLHVAGNALITQQLTLGNSSSSANLSIGGTYSLSFTTVSSHQTLGNTSMVFADTSSGNLFLTLPHYSNCLGRWLTVKKKSNTNTLTLNVQGEGNIDGSTHVVMTSGNSGTPSLSLLSSSNQWNIMEQVGTHTAFTFFFFEAESGIMGANYYSYFDYYTLGANVVLTDSNSVGNSPSHVNQLITYAITLPIGTYDLYGRYAVGAIGAAADSLFIGNGFGTKTLSIDNDWIVVNTLTTASGHNYVNPEGALAVDGQYDWIKMSTQITSTETVPTFVSTGGLQTFMVAHREQGFRLDAFAFVVTGETTTSERLSHQNITPTISDNMIGFQAESGTIGTNYTISTNASSLGGHLISSTISQVGEAPDSTANLATYTITIPAGAYDLYMRYSIDSNGIYSDSVFLGNGFGSKTISVATEWITLNTMNAASSSYVDPEGVEVTDLTLNWVRMSTQVNYSETAPVYYSTGGTQTFMIGHRESGFAIDAMAFVPVGSNPSSTVLNALFP
jgi:hypothetical protein